MRYNPRRRRDPGTGSSRTQCIMRPSSRARLCRSVAIHHRRRVSWQSYRVHPLDTGCAGPEADCGTVLQVYWRDQERKERQGMLHIPFCYSSFISLCAYQLAAIACQRMSDESQSRNYQGRRRTTVPLWQRNTWTILFTIYCWIWKGSIATCGFRHAWLEIGTRSWTFEYTLWTAINTTEMLKEKTVHPHRDHHG